MMKESYGQDPLATDPERQCARPAGALSFDQTPLQADDQTTDDPPTSDPDMRIKAAARQLEACSNIYLPGAKVPGTTI